VGIFETPNTNGSGVYVCVHIQPVTCFQSSFSPLLAGTARQNPTSLGSRYQTSSSSSKPSLCSNARKSDVHVAASIHLTRSLWLTPPRREQCYCPFPFCGPCWGLAGINAIIAARMRCIALMAPTPAASTRIAFNPIGFAPAAPIWCPAASSRARRKPASKSSMT
jgi:hypothetical protein